MGPIWKTYYKNSQALMFVIDSANPFQIAASTVLLQDCLQHEDLKNKPFLVVFTKTDIQGPISLTEFKNIMMFDLIIAENDANGQNVTIANCSGVTAEGIESIFEWISNLQE